MPRSVCKKFKTMPLWISKKEEYDMNISKISSGGCLCGAIRFEVSGPSIWRSLCYCHSCCLSAGAPVVAWACFNKDQVNVTSGVISHYESSAGVFRGFCNTCGTTLTYEREPRDDELDLNARPNEIFIATMTFDDPTMYPPEEHIRDIERVEWLQVSDELPRHQDFSSTHGFRQHQKSSRQ